MHWIVLIASAVLEAVWATALGQSEGFTRPVPTAIFGVAVVLSMIGLSYAMRSLPITVAYTVWIGLGAALTVIWAMLTGVEPVSPIKILLLAGLVGSVVGLKFVRTEPGTRTPVDRKS
ncbi:DMT family transporter [Arenivirga flava]|uniref:DMT family transporter n=1 Tax=Arenivirga flava TaxID=1930060 RepID=UPI0024E0BB6F|nr:multidrug efflux SMR transporter [Arenivirga flava]